MAVMQKKDATNKNRNTRFPRVSHKLVILIRIRHPRRTHRARLHLLFALPRRASNDLAIRIEHIILVLDELDGLALLELLDGLRERDVEDLAALGRAARGVERVRDICVGGRRRGAVGEIGSCVWGGAFVAGVAFEHVLLAGDARLVDEGAADGHLEAGGGLVGSVGGSV
jgi:hypothetical protein